MLLARSRHFARGLRGLRPQAGERGRHSLTLVLGKVVAPNLSPADRLAVATTASHILVHTPLPACFGLDRTLHRQAASVLLYHRLPLGPVGALLTLSMIRTMDTHYKPGDTHGLLEFPPDVRSMLYERFPRVKHLYFGNFSPNRNHLARWLANPVYPKPTVQPGVADPSSGMIVSIPPVNPLVPIELTTSEIIEIAHSATGFTPAKVGLAAMGRLSTMITPSVAASLSGADIYNLALSFYSCPKHLRENVFTTLGEAIAANHLYNTMELYHLIDILFVFHTTHVSFTQSLWRRAQYRFDPRHFSQLHDKTMVRLSQLAWTRDASTRVLPGLLDYLVDAPLLPSTVWESIEPHTTSRLFRDSLIPNLAHIAHKHASWTAWHYRRITRLLTTIAKLETPKNQAYFRVMVRTAPDELFERPSAIYAASTALAVLDRNDPIIADEFFARYAESLADSVEEHVGHNTFLGSQIARVFKRRHESRENVLLKVDIMRRIAALLTREPLAAFSSPTVENLTFAYGHARHKLLAPTADSLMRHIMPLLHTGDHTYYQSVSMSHSILKAYCCYIISSRGNRSGMSSNNGSSSSGGGTSTDADLLCAQRIIAHAAESLLQFAALQIRHLQQSPQSSPNMTDHFRFTPPKATHSLDSAIIRDLLFSLRLLPNSDATTTTTTTTTITTNNNNDTTTPNTSTNTIPLAKRIIQTVSNNTLLASLPHRSHHDIASSICHIPNTMDASTVIFSVFSSFTAYRRHSHLSPTLQDLRTLILLARQSLFVNSSQSFSIVSALHSTLLCLPVAALTWTDIAYTFAAQVGAQRMPPAIQNHLELAMRTLPKIPHLQVYGAAVARILHAYASLQLDVARLPPLFWKVCRKRIQQLAAQPSSFHIPPDHLFVSRITFAALTLQFRERRFWESLCLVAPRFVEPNLQQYMKVHLRHWGHDDLAAQLNVNMHLAEKVARRLTNKDSSIAQKRHLSSLPDTVVSEYFLPDAAILLDGADVANRVAYEVDGPRHFRADLPQHPLGRTVLKRRLCNLVGWTLHDVHVKQIDKAHFEDVQVAATSKM